MSKILSQDCCFSCLSLTHWDVKSFVRTVSPLCLGKALYSNSSFIYLPRRINGYQWNAGGNQKYNVRTGACNPVMD